MATYLGIDYGTKKIGLAWANELGVALPIGSISGVELGGCWDELKRVVKDRKIDEFVVGYPIHMSGKIGKRAKEVDAFIATLESSFKLSVHRIDERLTTVTAEETVKKKKNNKKADGRVDATAASLILNDFLNGGSLNG